MEPLSNAHRRREPVPDDRLLFEALYPALRRFAAVVADLDTDPDDLVQDALVATLRRHELSELRDPAAYLKRTILSSVSNVRRRHSLRRRLLPRLAEPASSTDHYPSDLSLLDALNPIDRAVVFLADVEGYPHRDIADQLGLTPAAVRQRVGRSRRALRRNLQPPPIVPLIEEQP